MKSFKTLDTVERERERATIYKTKIWKTVSEKNYTEKLNRIKTSKDLRNDEKLSLSCDIKKIKRTNYLKVVRVEEKKEKLKLQENSLSFL